MVWHLEVRSSNAELDICQTILYPVSTFPISYFNSTSIYLILQKK